MAAVHLPGVHNVKVSDAVFREVKRALSGEERVFECQTIAVTPRLAIVRFVFKRSLEIGGRSYPPGGWTEGFFWRNRNYNLYHIVSRDREPIADRFDVIDHVRIRPDGVRYDDLLLDIWLYPDGRSLVEDEDEVQDALSKGLLTEPRLAVIRRTERLLLSRGRNIVDRALEELSALL
jgi:uncharacterized protein DUF402